MTNGRMVVPQGVIAELKVSAHLMTLDPGLFCLFQVARPHAAADSSGLPGVRVTLAPMPGSSQNVTISAFHPDGWIGPIDDAALVRVRHAPAQVLVTVYQAPNGGDAPKLQVLRLHEADAMAPRAQQAVPALPSHTSQPAPQPQPPRVASPRPAEVGAHVQVRGDIGAHLGEWIGDRGSRRWIEGFAIAPASVIPVQDIEYQALLGRGWLSPWSEGGHFCGSRGMALPILGLRVRLRGESAERFDCVYTASFVDGTVIGPVRNGEACEAPSLAPLEAFQIGLVPRVAESPANQMQPMVKPVISKPSAAKPASKPVAKPKTKSTAKAATTKAKPARRR